MVNALERIEGVSGIEIRLQTNEVLITVDGMVDLAAIPRAIHEAGFGKGPVTITATGVFSEEGFTPLGWSHSIARSCPRSADAQPVRVRAELEISDAKVVLADCSPVELQP